MTFSIQQFQAALAQYDAQTGPAESPLDILWYCYCIASPTDDDLIRAAETELNRLTKAMPLSAADGLTDLVSQVCLAYQRAAFLDGMRVGADFARHLT